MGPPQLRNNLILPLLEFVPRLLAPPSTDMRGTSNKSPGSDSNEFVQWHPDLRQRFCRSLGYQRNSISETKH